MRYLIFLFILTLGCVSSKQSSITTHNTDDKSKELNDLKFYADSILIHCDGKIEKLQIYNIRNNYFLQNNRFHSQMKCIADGVNIARKESIEDIIKILTKITEINPYLKNDTKLVNDKTRGLVFSEITDGILLQKWRGPEIFQKILEVGDLHGCYKKSGLTCEVPYCFDVASVHLPFYQAYTSMIRNIDGMLVQDYLEINVPYSPERRRQDDADKCQESLNRDYYNEIVKAYKEGRIVLKKYGEE